MAEHLSPDTTPVVVQHPIPSSMAIAWRQATPFAALSPEARSQRLRESRMYGTADTSRIGSEAFEMRADIAVADACETVLHLLRGLIGALEVIATAPDTSSSTRDATSACAFVARQAAGAVAVMAAAVYPEQNSAPA